MHTHRPQARGQETDFTVKEVESDLHRGGWAKLQPANRSLHLKKLHAKLRRVDSGPAGSLLGLDPICGPVSSVD